MTLLPLDEALRLHVRDGDSVLVGAGLEALVPFAAGRELIRQKRRALTLIAPISDMLIDVLIGAGIAKGVIASWVGNVSAGSGYNFRRAIEEDIPAPLQMVDHTNFTLALALHAAALGAPYLPTRTALGTDLLAQSPHLKETTCPFTGVPLVAVEALTPDVAILPVQRADRGGNAHVWGNLGVIPDAARASKKVIVLAEEIVEPEVIRSDPNLTVIPGFLVTAVAHAPNGCHPSPWPGLLRPGPRILRRVSRELAHARRFPRVARELARQERDALSAARRRSKSHRLRPAKHDRDQHRTGADYSRADMTQDPLSEKVTLVTGSTRGIGRAIAEELAKAGATVVISARREKDVAEAVSQLRSEGFQALGSACDVRSYEEVASLMKFIADEASGLDILINNAGVGLFGHISELTPESWNQVIETNLTGVFNCAHAAIPLLKKRGGGAIINISSLAGKNAFRGGTAYNASKFGLEGLSEAMMLDLRYDDIKVAYVMPGSVATDFAGRAPGDGDDWRLSSKDVADAVMSILAQDHRALASRIELRPFQPPQK